MNTKILPIVKSLTEKSGSFNLKNITVQLSGNHDYRIVKATSRLRNILKELTGTFHKLCRVDGELENAVRIELNSDLNSEEYTLNITENGIVISGGDAAGCFYGIATLEKLMEINGEALPTLEIKDYPDLKCRGFYHDAARGRVPSIDGMKEMIDKLASYKINSFQLYVEHTFDLSEFSNDGRTDEDFLTADEILELDQYCFDRFIDFVPSISCFGHLYHLLLKKEYSHLRELPDYEATEHFWGERMAHHTIDPSNPRSFEVICSIIDQYLPLFRSEYFNICCDETFDLCCGRNKGKDKGKLYCDFVTKIIEHVTHAGKKVMMWGDIALEHPEALKNIPKDTVMLNWNYGKNPNEQDVMKIKEQGLTQVVCPGTTSWKSLIECPFVSVPNITKFGLIAKKHYVYGMLNTNWGDYGHPASPECSLYGTVLGACISWTVDTVVDECFERSVSYLAYGCEENIIPKINRLAEIHDENAAWCSFYHWNADRNKDCFKDFSNNDEYAIECERIADDLKKINGKEEILLHIINAAEGIALLNKAVDIIKNDKDREEWIKQSEAWLSDYEKCWLSGAKLSELDEIKSFIRKIMAF